jgi:hypothetical protein
MGMQRKKRRNQSKRKSNRKRRSDFYNLQIDYIIFNFIKQIYLPHNKLDE